MKNWRVTLGSRSSWSAQFVIAFGLVRLFIALISDPNRTQQFTYLWVVLWALSLVVMTLFVLLVMALGLHRRLTTKPRPIANLITIAIAGALGNVFVGVLANIWQIDTEGLWQVRVQGGAFVGIIVFSFVNGVRTALIVRQESIRQLTETERQLLGYRESAKQLIQDEIEALKAKTQNALLPTIEKIQSLISEHQEARSLAIDELKDLINNSVRPLSKSVLGDAAKLETRIPSTSINPSLKNTLRSKMKVARTMQAGILTLASAINFPMIEYLFVDHRSAFRGLLGAIGLGAVLYLCKLLISNRLELQTRTTIALHLFFSTIAVAPAYAFMFQEYGNSNGVLWATAFLWISALTGMLLLSISTALEISRVNFEKTLAKSNQELQREVALFEQKLGLEKRAWSRIIHGEVQAALTAAATRLQMHDKPEPYQIEMVKQDLTRAKENLTNPRQESTNFNRDFQEITSTWRSICTINADISARAQRALDSKQDVRSVTNEIIKEAVSNAVRHGQAKNVNIKLERIQDDILEIEISNDGCKAINPTPGLGSQMFDELTLSWSLNTKNNQTTLTAKVPISKN
ncbi:MAG: hypothetical protein ACKOWR_03080 [Micrococcales bacterium]